MALDCNEVESMKQGKNFIPKFINMLLAPYSQDTKTDTTFLGGVGSSNKIWSANKNPEEHTHEVKKESCDTPFNIDWL